MSGQIENPVINAPYDQPAWHFEIGPHGPTGELKKGTPDTARSSSRNS